MIHAKIDVKLHSHPKARKARAAMATWAWALCWIRDHETDGFIPDEAIGAAWVGEVQARKDAAVLVRVGLFDAVLPGVGPDGDGGWRLRKYADKNETRAEIDARRTEDRARKRPRSVRTPDGIQSEPERVPPESVVGIPGSGSGSGSGSGLESRSRQPTSKDRPVFAVGTASCVEAIDAFASGVAKATGKPYALARAPFHVRDLCDLLNAHAPPDCMTVRDVLRWLPTVVSVWLRARNDNAGPISPGKMLDWLNEPKRTGGGPRGDRQGLGGWQPPPALDDPFAPTGTEGT